MQLANKFVDTNQCIDAFENTIETMLYEQTIIIENRQEEMLIIQGDNSKEIINTRKEYKIKFQQSYLVSNNIQFAVQTHSSKTIKKVTRLKHITRGEGTHSNYRPNVNYNDNYNYKKNRDYNKPRTKTRSTVYVGSLTQACLLYTSRCV